MAGMELTFIHGAQAWAYANFLVLFIVFLVALYLNSNFNTWMVGLIYLLPMVPWGLNPDSAPRFLMQSWQNMVFGTIELVIFVVTVRPGDTTFDRSHLKQLMGHTFPIALALMGLSFVSRWTSFPLTSKEAILIVGVFCAGSILRVLSVYQLGAVAFKFDIVFRDQQKLQTGKLYRWIRHPSYTAMMIVILAYALTTHSFWVGALGMMSAWFGFQYRIRHEERALEEQFGEPYREYRERTGMWFPSPWKKAG